MRPARVSVGRCVRARDRGPCLGAITAAHHSRAGYDTAKERLTTHDGVVAEVIWRNPHVYLNWDAKDDKGTVVRWTGEFSSPATMISEGLSRTTFKAGDPLTLTFMPARAGTPQALVIKIRATRRPVKGRPT
jgi:hypothetical protein